jgi:hypothetical protein
MSEKRYVLLEIDEECAPYGTSPAGKRRYRLKGVYEHIWMHPTNILTAEEALEAVLKLLKGRLRYEDPMPKERFLMDTMVWETNSGKGRWGAAGARWINDLHRH